MYTPHLILFPFITRIINKFLSAASGHKNVADIFLLQNGDQILIKTTDSIWHKVCIQDIQSYKMVDKAKHIQISIVLENRTFVISTQKKIFVNFEILDRIIKGIWIQTNVNYSQTKAPANLIKDGIVEVDVKKALGIQDLTKKEVSESEKSIIEKFKEYGIPLYNESDFYKTHKISRIDFVNKIEELSEKQREIEILQLYENKSIKGRNIHLANFEKNIRKILDRKQLRPNTAGGLRSF